MNSRSPRVVLSSRRAILVADSSKYGRPAPVRIGHISEINHFVTDAAPPPALRRICEEARHGAGRGGRRRPRGARLGIGGTAAGLTSPGAPTTL
jgi:hypothetical protein